MFFLLIVALVVSLVIVVKEKNRIEAELRQTRESLKQRDQQWRQYIAAFKDRVSSEEEKSLLERLLRGDSREPAYKTQIGPYAAGGYPSSQEAQEQPVASTQEPEQTTSTQQEPHVSADASAENQPRPKQRVDNALILLYLGAFLFVVAAGLFVGLSDFSGEVRSMVVAVVAGLFYGGGLYLHKNKKRLRHAGVTFAAIGMATAPLVGLSLYSYVLSEAHGTAIWLGTSLVTFAMYLHALFKLRSGFISYLLIFSFISLMQSAVSIFDVPAYYFVWALILTGLVLQTASRYVPSVNLPELKEPAHLSSQVIIPLSVLVSFVLVGGEGLLQLAVTLGFSSAFYGLAAANETAESRRVVSAQAAHVLGMLAIGVGVYSIQTSFTDAALSLLVITAVHIGAVLVAGQSKLIKELGTTSLAATVPMVFLAFDSPELLLGCLGATIILGLAVSFRQDRADGLIFSIFATGLAPLVIGLMIIDPALDAGEIALLSLAAPLALTYLRWILLKQNRTSWLLATATPFAIVAIPTLVTTVMAEQVYMSLAASVVLAGVYAWLGAAEKKTEWAAGSGLVILTFVAHAVLVSLNPALALGMMLAIAWNIGLVLYFRNELPRWIASLLWLALPLAVGASGFEADINAAIHSWMYVAVLVGFMSARAVVILRNNQSRARDYNLTSPGVVYVAGYWLAGLASFMYALFAVNVSLQVSLVSGALILCFLVISRYIEEDRRVAAVVPLLLQVLAFSILNPSLRESSEVLTYLSLAQVVALLSYAASRFGPSWLSDNRSWYISAMVTLFVTPASLLFVGTTEFLMPIGLAIAGIVILAESWGKEQKEREASGWIIVVAVLWMMWYLGVDNLQAYTHVIALVFAGYALWRHVLGEAKQSDQYLMAMFLTATIPLALQALYGSSGDLYGWLLIFQQVGFVLLGMLIDRKFLAKWGMFVSIGAVLYQMRDLEWVVLLILAVSVIGIALYYLNRQSSD